MKLHGRMCASEVVYVSVTHRSQASEFLSSLSLWCITPIWSLLICGDVYLHLSVYCAFNVVWFESICGSLKMWDKELIDALEERKKTSFPILDSICFHLNIL